MTDANKYLVRRFFEEAWNQHYIAVLEELLTEDFVWHEPHHPSDLRGIERAQLFLEEQFTAFPDCFVRIEDLFGEGDRIAVRWLETGTHKGILKGLQPTDRTIAVAGMSLVRCQDGKIAEFWSCMDNLILLGELGAFDELPKL